MWWDAGRTEVLGMTRAITLTSQVSEGEGCTDVVSFRGSMVSNSS